MNEKLFALLLSLVMIITLAACGSSAGAKASEPDNMQAETSGEQVAGTSSNDSQYNEVTPFPTVSAPAVIQIGTLENGTMMRVLWTISNYVIATNATWGEEEAKVMLFKPLDITDSEIIFDGQACHAVTFQRETVTTNEYMLDSWNVTPEELGIDFQEIQVIKTNCTLPGFQEYMRLGDRRLIVPINGVFFFFEPAVQQ